MRDLVDTDAAERGHVYGLLSAVFRRPLDADMLRRLKAPEMLAALAAAGVDIGGEIDDADEKSVLDRLAIDFTQLFHGPVGRIAPYESVLLGDGDRELMGPAAQRVRVFMAEIGFEVAPESGELPDHISVELALMAELARREAEAQANGDAERERLCVEIQDRFLAEHLGRWAGPLGKRVREKAETAFYREFAGLLAGFVADDLAARAGRRTD